jgi:hypothetical protein
LFVSVGESAECIMNLSIMYFLAECNIPPLVTEHAAFREMISAAQQMISAAHVTWS